MKIKKFKFKQILKLHLLNSKAYEYAAKKISSGLLTDLALTQIISDFKKGLHLVFQYHQAQKRILFVGVPKQLEVKINTLTNHVALPSNFNLQGILSNNRSFQNSVLADKQSALKNNFKSLLPKLSKKPDLIVLFSHEKKQNVMIESFIAKVPLITFSSNDFSSNSFSFSLYNLNFLSNDFTETSNKNLFFLGLNFLFKFPKTKSFKQGLNLSITRKPRF